MGISLEVWGDYALFTRPEMKVERVSYDVMTPSAARGILDAVFWHPGMKWIIDRIHVCNPICFSNIRRNEVKAVASANLAKSVMNKGVGELYIATSDNIQQRASMVLENVRYVIDAHFVLTDKKNPGDNPAKFQEMMKRRIEKGQCYHTPYFGCREFPVKFASCQEYPPCPDSLRGERDLGFMLYDLDYRDSSNIQPMFFRAKLKDGVMVVPPPDSVEVLR